MIITSIDGLQRIEVVVEKSNNRTRKGMVYHNGKFVTLKWKLECSKWLYFSIFARSQHGKVSVTADRSTFGGLGIWIGVKMCHHFVRSLTPLQRFEATNFPSLPTRVNSIVLMTPDAKIERIFTKIKEIQSRPWGARYQDIKCKHPNGTKRERATREIVPFPLYIFSGQNTKPRKEES